MAARKKENSMIVFAIITIIKKYNLQMLQNEIREIN